MGRQKEVLMGSALPLEHISLKKVDELKGPVTDQKIRQASLALREASSSRTIGRRRSGRPRGWYNS